MPRKGKPAAAGPKPGELPVTYADMVTLLLTFFVFLMSMAEFDVQKLKDFFQAMGGAFGVSGASGAGMLMGGMAITSEQANLSAGTDPYSPPVNSMDNFRTGADTPGKGSTPRVHIPKESEGDSEKEQQQIQVSRAAQEMFENVALELADQQGLEATMTTQGLKITLEQSFSQFKSGSAELPPEAIAKLRELISTKLRPIIEQGFEIVVTGHTDNVPLGPETARRFKDNRGLSTERANNVLRVFESMGVPPQQISAAGYGEHKPIADNSTEEGRAKNRRIEILVKYKEFSAPDWTEPSPNAP